MPDTHETSDLSVSHKAGDTSADTERAAGSDHVLLFSQGVISRKQAMRHLGISYGELLDRVADRSLPLPRVSEDEANRMADVVVALMNLHER